MKRVSKLKSRARRPIERSQSNENNQSNNEQSRIDTAGTVDTAVKNHNDKAKKKKAESAKNDNNSSNEVQAMELDGEDVAMGDMKQSAAESVPYDGNSIGSRTLGDSPRSPRTPKIDEVDIMDEAGIIDVVQGAGAKLFDNLPDKPPSEDGKMPPSEDVAAAVKPPPPAAAVPQPPASAVKPPPMDELGVAAPMANAVPPPVEDPTGMILVSSLMNYSFVEPGGVVNKTTEHDYIYSDRRHIIEGNAQALFDQGVQKLEYDLSQCPRKSRSFVMSVAALNLIKQLRNGEKGNGPCRFLERVKEGLYVEIGDRVMLRRVLMRLNRMGKNAKFEKKESNIDSDSDGSDVDEDDVQEDEDVWDMLQLRLTNKSATPMHQPSQGGTPIRSVDNLFGEEDPNDDKEALSSQQGIEIRSSRNEQDNGDMVDVQQQEQITEEARHVKEMHEKFEKLGITDDDALNQHTGDGSQYDGNALRKGNLLMAEEEQLKKIARRLTKHKSSNSNYTAENTLKAMNNVADRARSGQRYWSLTEPLKELDNKKQEALEQMARETASFATLEQKLSDPVLQGHQFTEMTNAQTFKPSTPGEGEVETNNNELGGRTKAHVHNDHAGRVVGITGSKHPVPRYPCDICNAGGTAVSWAQSGFCGSKGWRPFAMIKDNRKWCRTHCSCDPTITLCGDCYFNHLEVKWDEAYPDHPKGVANNHRCRLAEPDKERKCVKCTKGYERHVCSCDPNSRYCADHFFQHFVSKLCREKTAQELADEANDETDGGDDE